MSETQNPKSAATPTVYFIDDSATMREVIKIAFRKENIQILACADAASAIAQFDQVPPDAVITDVIMPDKDGFQVCEFIKQHDRFGKTPVILMSGVVNRSVAERATTVKADELIRKPFQPQDLIVRVKNLLHPKTVVPSSREESRDLEISSHTATHALTGLFSPAPPPPSAMMHSASRKEAPAAVAVAPPPSLAPVALPQRVAAPTVSADTQKLRNEIRRLELLVKKLQAELAAEHEYCAALETHFKTLQESS